MTSSRRRTANLRTKIPDFRGFDSSRILILRGGILMSMGNSLERLSQAILAGNLSREIGRMLTDMPQSCSQGLSAAHHTINMFIIITIQIILAIIRFHGNYSNNGRPIHAFSSSLSTKPSRSKPFACICLCIYIYIYI